MAPKTVSAPPCQEIVWEGNDVDLARLPIQTCWPGDAGPLITWGLTVTKGPNKSRQNLGIYRQQLIGRNKLIMRWLAHRGGALDFREFALQNPGKPYPVAVALGADPATILGAVTPVPDTLSEYQFAGLLRGGRTELAKCITPGVDGLQVPARAEIVLEGFIYPQEGTPSPAPAGAPPRPSRALRGLRTCARRSVWRPHRLLQRAGMVSGLHRRAHHHAARCDLSLDLYRQAARRAGRARRRAERSVRAATAEAVHRDHRLLSAARRLQLPHGHRADEEELPRPRQARDVRRLELPAPVHVYEVHRRRRRGRQYPRLEGSDLGDHHAHRPVARHRAGRSHADRLSGFRLAGGRSRIEDGARRDQQMARRNRPRMGPPDRDGQRGQTAHRRLVERVGPLRQARMNEIDIALSLNTHNNRANRAAARMHAFSMMSDGFFCRCRCVWILVS